MPCLLKASDSKMGAQEFLRALHLVKGTKGAFALPTPLPRRSGPGAFAEAQESIELIIYADLQATASQCGKRWPRF